MMKTFTDREIELIRLLIRANALIDSYARSENGYGDDGLARQTLEALFKDDDAEKTVG